MGKKKLILCSWNHTWDFELIIKIHNLQYTAPDNQSLIQIAFDKNLNYRSIFTPQGVGFILIKKVPGRKHYNKILSGKDFSGNEPEEIGIFYCAL